MEQLHSSLTASDTSAPHLAPRAEFRFGTAAEGRRALPYPQGAPIDLEVVLSPVANYGEALLDATGSVWLATAEGKLVRRLGSVAVGMPLSLSVALEVPPGVYRLTLRGIAELSPSGKREFVVRSRPLEVLP